MLTVSRAPVRPGINSADLMDLGSSPGRDHVDLRPSLKGYRHGHTLVALVSKMHCLKIYFKDIKPQIIFIEAIQSKKSCYVMVRVSDVTSALLHHSD